MHSTSGPTCFSELTQKFWPTQTERGEHNKRFTHINMRLFAQQMKVSEMKEP